MDVYGITSPDYFRIDDLLDLSNPDLLADSSSCPDFHSQQYNLPPPQTATNTDTIPFNHSSSSPSSSSSFDFSADLCVPVDDVAELEWLSRFVDDSFSDIPSNSLVGTLNLHHNQSTTTTSTTTTTVRPRGKRSRHITIPSTSSSTRFFSSRDPDHDQQSRNYKAKSTPNLKREIETRGEESVVRRCTHCASEKTPQWRTGPLGPKTLCNACGVRYKSGRLVPEYRPAASPSFVLTKHSNSHRKVIELRRQKEFMMQQQ